MPKMGNAQWRKKDCHLGLGMVNVKALCVKSIPDSGGLQCGRNQLDYGLVLRCLGISEYSYTSTISDGL